MIRLPCGIYFNEYQKECAYIHTRSQGIVFLLFLAALFFLPLYIPEHFLSFFIITAITLIAVTGLQITTGYSGQINLGQSAFMGVGAFICGAMVNQFETSFFVNLILAAIGGGIFGVFFGIPAIRIKGFYLALVSIAAQIIFPMLIIQLPSRFFGGPSGLNLKRPEIFGIGFESDHSFYLLTITITCIVLLLAFNLVRTNVGRAFLAIRDNDKVVELIGFNLKYYRVLAFAIGGFYAGVAGCLWSYYLGYICADQFTLHNSIWYLGMIIVGGTGSIFGGIVGTLCLKTIHEMLNYFGPLMVAFFPQIGSTEVWFGLTNVLLGGIILLFLIVEPRGFAHRWNIIKFGWRIWPFPYA